MESGEFGRFFVVPLQVFNDSQVRVHSDFSSVRNFLLHVLTSFSFHAPQNTSLLIKHHPMDRGFIDYGKVIKHFIKRHPKLKGSIHYVHDVPRPDIPRQPGRILATPHPSGRRTVSRLPAIPHERDTNQRQLLQPRQPPIKQTEGRLKTHFQTAFFNIPARNAGQHYPNGLFLAQTVIIG